MLMVLGNILDNIFMAGGARSKGASWWAIGLSWVAMILGGIWLTPIGGLAAALVVLFVVEWIRIKDHKKLSIPLRTWRWAAGGQCSPGWRLRW